MCYFLYISTDVEISSDIISSYDKTHDIHIDKINEYLELIDSKSYYLIHRQCSCDFIRASNNSFNELSELFKILKKPFELVLLDANLTPDTDKHLSELFNSRFLSESLRLNKFLYYFPLKISTSKIYIIRAC